MVDGFRKWQRDGLKLSPRIRGEMAAYRKESDLLGEFLSDTCEFGPTERVPERDLYHVKYVPWCHENGVRPNSKKAFTRALVERGVVQGVVRGGRCYLGLRLRD
jgi:putative DNA primase/helicase